MDKVVKYQQVLESLLEEFADQMSKSDDTIQNQVIVDSKRHHYQLFSVGWKDQRYFQSPVFHFDILDGKIWLQVNNTDIKIAQELMNRGVPSSDIVLGLQHPLMRQYSGFAVA